MKQKQLIVLAACMAGLLSLLCGCGSGGNERDTAPVQTPAPAESARPEPTAVAAPEPEPEQDYELPEVDDVPARPPRLNRSGLLPRSRPLRNSSFPQRPLRRGRKLPSSRWAAAIPRGRRSDLSCRSDRNRISAKSAQPAAPSGAAGSFLVLTANDH